MSKLYHEKVVSSLPGTLVKNTIYYVRTGAGFNMYITNDLGIIVAYPLNSSGPNITSGTSEPSGGVDGDIYLQYN
jgi:hypothetical protein